MMRMRWLILAGGLLLVPASQACAQKKTPEEIVDRAIEAHGGKAVMDRARVMVRRITGTLYQDKLETTFTDEMTTDLPNRHRLKMLLGPQKQEMVVVINGDEGWMHTGGQTQPMSRTTIEEAREEGFTMYVATLTPLRRDKDITLKAMPEGKVKNLPADVVRVSAKGREDVDLYFDRGSGLLVKMSKKTTFQGLSVNKEYLFEGFENSNGAKLPTVRKELLNGRPLMEGRVTSYSFPEKPPAQAFAKP